MSYPKPGIFARKMREIMHEHSDVFSSAEFEPCYCKGKGDPREGHHGICPFCKGTGFRHKIYDANPEHNHLIRHRCELCEQIDKDCQLIWKENVY